ncbi:hypothetical protein B0H13DRAFT_1861969 [Mycena leptocephala]|nr:hypothetical protein B0H13DRAFT_1861969 [Mycena leptocephala]
MYALSLMLWTIVREPAKRSPESLWHVWRGLNHVLMNNQAEVHKLKSEYVEAHTIHTHILQEASVERDPYYHALALLNVAEIDMSMGAQEQHVEKNIQTAQKLFNTRRLGMEMMMCETILADLHLRGGNPLVAERLNAPSGTVEELEDNLSDIEDLEEDLKKAITVVEMNVIYSSEEESEVARILMLICASPEDSQRMIERRGGNRRIQPTAKALLAPVPQQPGNSRCNG